jgi:hypothetical protein
MPEDVTPEKESGKSQAEATKAQGVPAKVSAQDCLKAVKVLSDKGGTGRSEDLLTSFGGDKYAEILGRSLVTMTRLNILEKSGNTYSLGKMGGIFVAAQEEEKKRVLAERLASFPLYKDVFIRLMNDPQKSIKKEELTEMWVRIAGGGKHIRQDYTMSFSSLTSWCGMVEDTGRTLKLTDVGIRLVEGKPLGPVQPQPPTAPSGEVKPAEVSPPCPMCEGSRVGLKCEEVGQTIPTKSGHLVYIRRVYYCRNCRAEFTRLHTEMLQGPAP